MSGAAPLLLADGTSPARLVAALEEAWSAGRAVALARPADRQALTAAIGSGATLARWEAAVVLGSGGSSGGRRWCVQPLEHLQASADATARWLGVQGIDPAACLHLDPLPLHHVSGLLPLVRSRRWGGAAGSAARVAARSFPAGGRLSPAAGPSGAALAGAHPAGPPDGQA